MGWSILNGPLPLWNALLACSLSSPSPNRSSSCVIGSVSLAAFWIPTPKLRSLATWSHGLGSGALRPTWKYGVSGSASTARPPELTKWLATSVLTPWGPLSKG